MRSFSKDKWSGPDKLVIGIDLGTTQSAVSYAHLYSGGPQEVTRVSKWPGVPDHRVVSKIPTIIYYNEREEPVLFGAEADTFDAHLEAEEKGWRLAKHFKLHLHPESLRAEHKLATEDLPFNLTVERLYADFLRYLLDNTRLFFESRTADGAKIWRDLIDKASIVIAHPNGWSLREQSILRRAAIQADIVPSGEAGVRVTFVSEGEASVHYCIKEGNIASKMKEGTKFLVCDAGGSTVDTTAYVVKKLSPSLVLQEAKASGCVQAGGIFVNQEALWQLRTAFDSAQVPRPILEEWLRNANNDFELNLKPDFPRPTGRYTVTVERASYTNRDLGIKNGRLLLSAENVAQFFEPCVRQIENTIRHQLSEFDAQRILLVGGFGESKYLQDCLRQTFATPESKRELTIVQDGTSKAVADGAVIYSCTRAVSARVARYSYGTTVHPLYDPNNPAHANRMPYERPDGTKRVKNAWKDLVLQGTLLKDDTTQAIFYDYPTLEAARQGLRNVRQVVYSHPEFPPAYTFVRDPAGELVPPFEQVCEITADLSDYASSLSPIERPSAESGDGAGEKNEPVFYYKAYFKIKMTFGETELKAYIQWEQDGETKTGPAKVVAHLGE